MTHRQLTVSACLLGMTLALLPPPVVHSQLKPINGALAPVDHKSVVVFKTTPQGDLKTNLYFPRDWNSNDHRPAIVFFFGGGCSTGSPAQFATKAEYFATRGMVAATAEYRIASIHHTGPVECVEDAKSAVRWLRMNARRLGVDPGHIVAAGGSSGGTAAAFAAYNTNYEPKGEASFGSSRPDALVLINPALSSPGDTSHLDPEQTKMREFITSWKVVRNGPPAILFYGTEDDLLGGGRVFTKEMIAAGNRAELYTAAGQKHGFSSEGAGSPWHALVLRQSDLFLSSLGFLKGPPTISFPAGTQARLTNDLP